MVLLIGVIILSGWLIQLCVYYFRFGTQRRKCVKVAEKKKITDDIFTFPLFDENLCDILVEELNHFKDSGLAHSRPNSMNR